MPKAQMTDLDRLTVGGSASIGFPVFLTAYDPSDLPGGSLDLLGFERGYLLLADKILPGLTNVADRPRYFSVLCAGVSIAGADISDPPRLQYQRRLDCIQRFERFWALANVLARQEASDGELPVSGIRGVSYAAGKAESLLRTDARRVGADFKMLSRQVPYGVVGIYGALADGMRLLDRKTFTLSPDLGERLAEGFLAETDTPSMLLRAVREDGDIPLAKLAEWGRQHNSIGERSGQYSGRMMTSPPCSHFLCNVGYMRNAEIVQEDHGSRLKSGDQNLPDKDSEDLGIDCSFHAHRSHPPSPAVPRPRLPRYHSAHFHRPASHEDLFTFFTCPLPCGLGTGLPVFRCWRNRFLMTVPRTPYRAPLPFSSPLPAHSAHHLRAES